MRMKNFEKITSSRKVRFAAGTIGALILALLVFRAGVVVGSHRGQFRGDLSREHGFRSPFFLGNFEMPHGFLQDGHGAVGSITAITLPTFLIETRDGANQTILISTSTLIRDMHAPDATTTLSVGDRIIVLGDPDNQGRINARIINVFPSASPLP